MKKKASIILSLIVALVGAVLIYVGFEFFGVFDSIDNMLSGEKTKMEAVAILNIPKVRIVDENSKTRPIGVSINNNRACYPHAGLQDAYLVYELIAEGGITRFMAFYKDQDTQKIGSVRSARHYFLDYILENDAIFVHFGHSPQALEDISSLKIDDIDGIYDSGAFYRDKTLNKAYEHTAFGTTEKINNVISEKKFRTTSDEMLLKYSPFKIDLSKDSTVEEANKVSIEYSSYQTSSYEYDKENMVYKSYMAGKEHVDAITNKQYTVKNIITYKVKNTSMDSYGRQNLDNVGSGEGYYITNGQAIKIKWKKENRSSKTVYTYMDGKELIVNDGNTWIHIEPTGKTLKIS